LVLNKWYQSTFLGQRREEFLALLEKYLGKKEGGALHVHI